MSVVIERYNPVSIGVNTTIKTTASGMGTFLCITSGALSVTDGLGNTVINSFPVSAGTSYPLPFRLHHSASNNGASITTSGGASGVLGLS